MNQQEIELRRKVREVNLKVDALDWLDKKAQGVPTEHTFQCNAMDLTGWPAPCSCGFSDNKEVKIIELLKGLLTKEM